MFLNIMQGAIEALTTGFGGRFVPYLRSATSFQVLMRKIICSVALQNSI
jgi:hypothetical protein